VFLRVRMPRFNVSELDRPPVVHAAGVDVALIAFGRVSVAAS
jgi:hypothetical protein